MRGLMVLLGVWSVACGCGGPPGAVDLGEPEPAEAVRFRPLHVELVIEHTHVSAYQVELLVVSGEAVIVGIEGSTLRGFEDPPFYDREALAGGRVVLAAFSAEHSLPPGRHRVCTVHMQESGAPRYELRLITVGQPDASRAKAEAFLVVEGDGR